MHTYHDEWFAVRLIVHIHIQDNHWTCVACMDGAYVHWNHKPRQANRRTTLGMKLESFEMIGYLLLVVAMSVQMWPYDA
jgi:hypothetical protein